MNTHRLKETQAFTLIELLIVVTIISIIGIASIWGFSRMRDMQDSETMTKIISNSLASFDRSIQNHEITSYEVFFDSGSLGFITNTDWYKNTSHITYMFDFLTKTGILMNKSTSTGMWNIEYWAYETQPQSNILVASGGIQAFSFPKNLEKRWYQISNSADDMNLNDLTIQYYNLTNRNSLAEEEVTLIKIEGWDGVSYSSLLVRNVLGKKVLQGSWSTLDDLEKAIITFEKNGKEMEMVISK